MDSVFHENVLPRYASRIISTERNCFNAMNNNMNCTFFSVSINIVLFKYVHNIHEYINSP